MKDWNNLSTSRRLAKPKIGPHLSQQLACMYSKMKYLGQIDGVGCLKFSILCKKEIESNMHDIPLFGKDLNFICDACKCKCAVLYYRPDSPKLAQKLQRERDNQRDSLKQTKLACFK